MSGAEETNGVKVSMMAVASMGAKTEHSPLVCAGQQEKREETVGSGDRKRIQSINSYLLEVPLRETVG